VGQCRLRTEGDEQLVVWGNATTLRRKEKRMSNTKKKLREDFLYYRYANTGNGSNDCARSEV
jgi:hypothetical protein